MQSPATTPGTLSPPAATPRAASPRTATYPKPSPEQAVPAPPPATTTCPAPDTNVETADPLPSSTTSSASSHNPRWHPSKWITCAVANRERGMSTAEYAVGTIAACAFAALLFKVVSSPEVQDMLKSLIDRALKTTG
ncbi:DUF4244 domain-containing protein [Nonomuraea sp. NPDC052265]|uniref:DUF4244 domain-containing protein n=1 Tax=Nonomuraea sp. NPDC052265 TaxID=3364374 RepID=UPI0037C74D1B